MALARVSTFYF